VRRDARLHVDEQLAASGGDGRAEALEATTDLSVRDGSPLRSGANRRLVNGAERAAGSTEETVRCSMIELGRVIDVLDRGHNREREGRVLR